MTSVASAGRAPSTAVGIRISEFGAAVTAVRQTAAFDGRFGSVRRASLRRGAKRKCRNSRFSAKHADGAI